MVAIVSTVAYLGLEARAVEVQVQLIARACRISSSSACRQGGRRKPRAGARRDRGARPRRCRPSGSPSTSRPPTCPRKARISICRSRWRCSPRWASSMPRHLAVYVVVGELGLDGRIAPSPGVLLAAIHASAIGQGPDLPRRRRAPKPPGRARSRCVAAPDLLALLNHLARHRAARAAACRARPRTPGSGPDLAQVKGQETAKRALEIAAAGGAQSPDDRAAGRGQVADGGLSSRHPAAAGAVRGARSLDDRQRRRRADGRPADPHPAVPRAAPQRLDAGAGRRRPEGPARARSASRISACCFSTSCPSSSAPCSIRCASRSRPARSTSPAPTRTSPFPARVQLVAAMNPCRCGHLGDPALACAPRAALRRRLSGAGLGAAARPHRPPCRRAGRSAPPISPCRRRPRASAAVAAPRRRRARDPDASATPARACAPMPRPTASCSTRVATPDEPGRALLAQAADAMRLSARGYHRVLRVARTIADLAGSRPVGRIHVAEALSYRRQAPRS